MSEPLDWLKLPDDLRWLAEPAERYGHIQFEAPIYEYLRNADAAERAALRALGQRYGGAAGAINEGLDRFSIVVHPEAALVYFTGVLLGTGDDAGLL